MDNEVAFRFSRKLGIVANNDLAGEPVYITLKNLKTVNVPEDDGKKKVDGIAYNVPGKAQVTLIEGKKNGLTVNFPLHSSEQLNIWLRLFSIKNRPYKLLSIRLQED